MRPTLLFPYGLKQLLHRDKSLWIEHKAEFVRPVPQDIGNQLAELSSPLFYPDFIALVLIKIRSKKNSESKHLVLIGMPFSLLGRKEIEHDPCELLRFFLWTEESCKRNQLEAFRPWDIMIEFDGP